MSAAQPSGERRGRLRGPLFCWVLAMRACCPREKSRRMCVTSTRGNTTSLVSCATRLQRAPGTSLRDQGGQLRFSWLGEDIQLLLVQRTTAYREPPQRCGGNTTLTEQSIAFRVAYPGLLNKCYGRCASHTFSCSMMSNRSGSVSSSDLFMASAHWKTAADGTHTRGADFNRGY